MTDGSFIHRLVCKKMSLATFFEQFLVVLNLKYLRRILRSENGHLTTIASAPYPSFLFRSYSDPKGDRSN